MSVVWYALWFVIAVGLLVTVHEFGHFWVARRLGFKVLRFSVGFGRPLLKRVAGADRTEYVLAAIPLGGYVKLLDEREGRWSRTNWRAPSRAVRPATHRGAARRPCLQHPVRGAGAVGHVVGERCDEVRPVIGEVTRARPPPPRACMAGTRSHAQRRHGERPARCVFGLLDAMSSRGEADLSVRGSGGERAQARTQRADAAQRRRLTEPAELFRGLDFSSGRRRCRRCWAGDARWAAARAGLQAGDNIVAIDGQPVHDFARSSRSSARTLVSA